MMKRVLVVGMMVALMAAAQDPTKPTARMADTLKARVAESNALRLEALVVGSDEDGVALVGTSEGGLVPLRAGARLQQEVDGVRVALTVKAVTVKGVELETGTQTARIFLPGSFKSLAAPTNPPPHFIRHLEATQVPLERLLRLVSDQTGVNISSSAATAKQNISIFLRNVTAATAVEEICRTAGLWFRHEEGSDVIRVTTMDEYAQNLSSFREEKTETFTLLYPNVVEAAAVIYGIYPDRTLLSLGEEDFDEDQENDLSRRFRRFQTIADNGGSAFLKMEAPDSNAGGGRTGSGVFSYSRGGGLMGMRTQWDWLRKAAKIQGLTQTEAKRIESAAAAGNTNLYETAYRQSAQQSANIFVTISRRNNMLIVRTSDTTAMASIRDLVQRIDVPTPMVLLEMRVLELDVDDDYNATFKYSFNTTGSHSWGHHGGSREGLERTTTTTSTDSDGNTAWLTTTDYIKQLQGGVDPSALNPVSASTMSFAILSDSLNAQLELMQQDGKVRTLATPTLLTANNEVSRIFSGAEYPIVKGVTAGQTVTTEAGFNSHEATVDLEWTDIGTLLFVTPNINADKTVTLHVLQENSDIPAEQVRVPLDGSDLSATTPIDIVESRSLTGTFVAKDGMTVMAGGLIKETWKEVYTRTPVLGSIPWIGWLFRGTEKQKKRTELIVLIKPHVISTPMEGGKISQELMKALSAHPAADGRASMGIHKPANPKKGKIKPGALKDIETMVR